MNQAALLDFILFFPGFLFSLSFHESAHGYIASKFGDPTAERLGRVTLNPLPHMDPIGTFLLPVLGFFLGGVIIGWGVPVPVDYRNLKNPKTDGLFIALAGPMSNLLLAVIIAGLLHALDYWNPPWLALDTRGSASLVLAAVVRMFYLNLALTFFNLIPIHPLDGGKVLYGLLPQPYAAHFDHFLGRYGFILLLILFMTGIYKVLVWYPVEHLARWLL